MAETQTKSEKRPPLLEVLETTHLPYLHEEDSPIGISTNTSSTSEKNLNNSFLHSSMDWKGQDETLLHPPGVTEKIKELINDPKGPPLLTQSSLSSSEEFPTAVKSAKSNENPNSNEDSPPNGWTFLHDVSTKAGDHSKFRHHPVEIIIGINQGTNFFKSRCTSGAVPRKQPVKPVIKNFKMGNRLNSKRVKFKQILKPYL